MIGMEHFLIFSILLFAIGFYGLLLVEKKSVINILMSVELILLSANINFISASIFRHDIVGQVFSMFVFLVAASEAAIGLAILVAFFKINENIDVEKVSIMKE